MDPVITPAQASAGYPSTLPDDELPGLAATWVAEGFDSPALVELAGLSRREGKETGRRLFERALEELGYPVVPEDLLWQRRPWRGRWPDIAWAVQHMDDTHSPYASAQMVLEILEDVPELWDLARGSDLYQLLRRYDSEKERRAEVLEAIRVHLRSLREEDVPPHS